MVEGHGVHRVARAHIQKLLNKRFKAISPNGRFQVGAQAIDSKTLYRIEAHGKNLFYFFTDDKESPGSSIDVVRVHFGMSGAFRINSLPGPDPRPTTRLSLIHQESNTIAQLSAMICEHGDIELYNSTKAKLGPDPLREDALFKDVFERMKKCKKSIGLFLMDQKCVAGVGNIFRSEILFKAGLHPETPAHVLCPCKAAEVWRQCVELMQIGFQSGSINTVDPEEQKILGKQWQRRYVYNQNSCGRCGSKIVSWQMASRTVYACLQCQWNTMKGCGCDVKFQGVDVKVEEVRLFPSKCASDPIEMAIGVPEKLTVKQLRQWLAEKAVESKNMKKAKLVALVKEIAVKTGTAHIDDVISARDAAMEKKIAGESAAVEHVAWHDDASDMIEVKKRTFRRSIRVAKRAK